MKKGSGVAEKVCAIGAKKAVISGIHFGDYLGNVIYEVNGARRIIRTKRIGNTRAGTGDIFAAIIAADCVNQIDFSRSVKKASSFIRECMKVTEEKNIPPEDGVCFEEVLCRLK